MRIHRFFIDKKIEEDRVLITDDQVLHQWRNVFRYNVGSEVVLFDGFGMDYRGVIEKLTNKEAVVGLVDRREGVIIEKKVTLYQSLIKKDNMEFVVEKATELGVSKIAPIISERSEKKGFNIERAKKIAIEASEQCGRGSVPEIGEVLSLEEVLNDCQNPIVFGSKGEVLIEMAPEVHDGKSLTIFIGPEGGWSEKEINLFKEKNAKIYSLGPLTLRAETATIVALSKFL